MIPGWRRRETPGARTSCAACGWGAMPAPWPPAADAAAFSRNDRGSTMSSPRPRPGILEITPYVGGKAGSAGSRPIAKLSANESPLGPSPKAVAAYRDLAAELHRYPDGHCTLLRQALGRRHNLDPDAIVCG